MLQHRAVSLNGKEESRDQTEILDQILQVKRIYTPGGFTSTVGTTEPRCSSVCLCIRVIICAPWVCLRSFLWGSDHHGFKTSSFPLLIELTCRLLMCSLGTVSSFPFCFHSCPFQHSALLLFPRLGMSVCRGREVWDTSAEFD